MEKQKREESSIQQSPWMIAQKPMNLIYPFSPYTVDPIYPYSVGEHAHHQVDEIDLLALPNPAPVSGQTSWSGNVAETTRGLMIRDEISPICLNTVEEQSRWTRVEEWRFDMNQMSFGDFGALSNNASGQTTPWATNALETTRNAEKIHKCNDSEDIFCSVSNDAAKQIIKTPEKPKRKKHRPKVVREAKPKKEPKMPTSRKSVGADGQESKTPKRKYVRKKVEVNKDHPVELSASVETSAHAKKLCRRALNFEAENGENETNSNTEHADQTKSVPREKLLGSGNQEDCLLSDPILPTIKHRQGKRKGTEPKKSGGNQGGVDLSIAQAAKRRQGKEPTCGDMNLSGIQHDQLCDY